MPHIARPLCSTVLAGVLAALVAVLVVAATAVPASAAVTPVRIGELRATGARTQVVVGQLRSRAQADWIDHVVDEALVSVEGCVADPSRSALRRGTYSTQVYLLCAGGGVVSARRAAAALTASRPWYRVTVTPVAVEAFTFVADLAHGTGDPVNAALAQLPFDDFTFVDGDDVSLTYVGTGVTQAELDAARAAFAAQLHIATAGVAVAPLHWG